MSATAKNSTLTLRLSRVVTLIKKRGPIYIARILISQLALQLEIRIRGQSKTIILDGCRFPLRDIPNTSMKLNLLRGSYEAPERSAALRYIKPNWPVVELGGCIGVVACITNKLLDQPERHVVVEANPLVVAQLEANRAGNQSSFLIVNRALAYESTSIRLMPSPDFWGTSLYERGDSRPCFDVPTTQLEKLVEDARFDSFALICDIEGQEYELIRNELRTLKKAEIIIMEIHPHVLGEDKISEIYAALGTIGFQIIDHSASVVVMGRV